MVVGYFMMQPCASLTEENAEPKAEKYAGYPRLASVVLVRVDAL